MDFKIYFFVTQQKFVYYKRLNKNCFKLLIWILYKRENWVESREIGALF